MTTTPGSFTFFSQDGLDTIFWGFVFVLAGTLLALLGIAHFAFSILGAIAAIIGWLFAVMGMSSLRRDYRTESPNKRTISSTATSICSNTNLSNMWGSFDVRSSISKMVLPRRPKVHLRKKINPKIFSLFKRVTWIDL